MNELKERIEIGSSERSVDFGFELLSRNEMVLRNRTGEADRGEEMIGLTPTSELKVET